MVKAESSEKAEKSIFEKLGSALITVSVIMAFAIGILWEKVNNLEGGNAAKSNSSPTTAPAAGAKTSKLTDLEGLAKSSGVDVNKFKQCYSGTEAKAKVEKQQSEGAAAGVQGTPAGFIVNQAGEVWRIPGALTYDMIKPYLDLALGKTSESALPTGSPIVKMAAAEASKLVKVSSADHIRGDKNAKVFMIEYSDYECPFCIRFHPTTKQVTDNYKDVALVYRHFPLEQLHPNAKPAAIASECVFTLGGEDAFWKFTDLAFAQ